MKRITVAKEIVVRRPKNLAQQALGLSHNQPKTFKNKKGYSRKAKHSKASPFDFLG